MDDDFDDDDDDDFQRKPRTPAQQAAADELKRQQLEKILEEQVKKFKEREKRLQIQDNNEAIHGNGVVGRYVNQNQMRMAAKSGQFKAY